MAVAEYYESRRMHITKDGSTLTQIFTCSDSDFNSWGDGTTALPILGQAWTPAREDLRVTDIRSRWLNNKTVRVEALYSTQGLSSPSNLPDRVSSIQTIFDFEYTPLQVLPGGVYWDYIAGESKEWTAVYEAANAGKPVPSIPPVFPHISMTEKMNLSSWNWNDIINTIGKVNTKDFLKQLEKVRSASWIDITGDDAGDWLFSGFHCDKLGYKNYEATLHFLYDGAGWNTPYGVTTNMYETANFIVLPRPDNYDDTINDGLR